MANFEKKVKYWGCDHIDLDSEIITEAIIDDNYTFKRADLTLSEAVTWLAFGVMLNSTRASDDEAKLSEGLGLTIEEIVTKRNQAWEDIRQELIKGLPIYGRLGRDGVIKEIQPNYFRNELDQYSWLDGCGPGGDFIQNFEINRNVESYEKLVIPAREFFETFSISKEGLKPHEETWIAQAKVESSRFSKSGDIKGAANASTISTIIAASEISQNKKEATIRKVLTKSRNKWDATRTPKHI